MTTYSSYTDQELTALLRAGNHQAFTEVFNRYSSLLYAHAFNKLRDEADARDVVQEMFIALWAKHDHLDAGNNLSGYLYMAVRNAIFNLVKHKKVVSAYAETFTKINQQITAPTDYLIRERQFAAMIENEIAALPPRMRAVFDLRRHENLSNKEIAERLGIAESTVADQMKKALRILKPKIGLILVLISWMDS
ncbi:RNA polymerase sigma-70 factor [Pedobacter heparinus]|uniref:RNA polymerase sigma factor n=1 Tax=Pedobacter heparinus TaxID=984 RepID=UPI002931EF9C|nr:RNA polymerase sigma-70 factor [Pedobacter heparinus]